MTIQTLSTRDTLTVAASGTQSTAITCDGAVPVLILWPAALTATAATIQVSADGGSTWRTAQALTGGADYSIPAAASEAQPLDINVTRGAVGLTYRLVMGTAEAAERSITVVRRPV